GYVVKVGDVAHIEDSVAEPETIASVNGKPAVVMNIRKQSGTNTVEVVHRLRGKLDELKTGLPKGWQMNVVRDQSDYIVSCVAVADRGVSSGCIHGRHRRSIHELVRCDDGDRDRGLPARFIHADADDVVALVEIERCGTRRRDIATKRLLRGHRAHVSAHARLVDGASMGDGRRHGPRLLVDGADRKSGQQKLPAAG